MPSGSSRADTASIIVNIFDGTRRLIPRGIRSLVRLFDGKQRKVHEGYHSSPSILFRNLQVRDNAADNYTVVVSADKHAQAGFTPIPICRNVVSSADIMLLPKDGTFHFGQARWDTLGQTRPKLIDFLAHGVAGSAARQRYEELMENRAPSLAALLNITTAMEDVILPVGNVQDYCKELVWDQLAQDRFFAWVSEELISQVKQAAEQGVFVADIGSWVLHPGATSSFRQVQFGEANLQLTFHENETRTVDGTTCVKLEADIDYYRDMAAHALLEVLPHLFTGGKTDPKTVYVLRWMAGRHAGVPEFNPPYTIEA